MTKRALHRISIAAALLALFVASPMAAAADDEITYTPTQLEAFRQQMDELRASYLAIADDLGDEARAKIEETLSPLVSMSDEDVADLLDTGAAFDELIDATREMEKVTDGLAEIRADGPAKSAGVPGAPYSASCGSRRNDTDALFTARSFLETAEGVFSVADRACNQVAVAAGFGGNTSSACIVADGVLSAARYVYDTFAFCDGAIDAAEIRGSYQRLGHIHGDIEALDRSVSSSNDEAIANANANRDLILANDDANHAEALERSDVNTAIVIGEIETTTDASIARETENFLRLRECTAWMYTPSSMGGLYETVVGIVDGVVDDASALGSVPSERIATARVLLATAEQLADERPLDATQICRGLIGAYAEATPSEIDRVPVPGE